MTDNPADLLRRAADTIREAANNASPAPWLTAEGKPWLAQRTVFGQSMHWGDHIAQVCSTDYGQNRNPDAEYIALMHPGVGAAVAEWLDYAARRHDALIKAAHQVWADDTVGRDKHIADETDQRALAVARAVLGEVAE